MRTNINMDDELLRRAMKHARVKTKTAAVHQALAEFVAERERLDLREIAGKIRFAPGYDHKRARTAP